MDVLDKTLGEFVELFQGSSTYFGASTPLGHKRDRDGKQEFRHWVEPKPMTKDDWLQHLKGDCSKAKNQLLWKPKYTFESMLDEMIEYWMNKLNN